MDRAWKIKLVVKALALGALTIAAMTFLFYTAAERFQSWPI